MAKGQSSTWYKVFLLLTLYVGLFIVFIGESYLVKVIEVEGSMNRDFYSGQVAEKSSDRGSRWFTAVFVDTQIMAHTFEPFIPTEEEMQAAKGMEDFGRPVFQWWEGRLRAWWTLIWACFVRLSSVLLWAPYSLLFIVPWLVDGLVEREKGKHTFAYASPMRNRYAMMALAVMPLVFLIILTAPLPLHPLTTPILLILIGVMVYQLVANFMKRA